MLRFQNQDFGPRTEEYNPKTKVWSVWFRKDGQPPEFSESDLIFNFYGWPGPTPEKIAQAFLQPRENMHIIWKFSAPDDVTKMPAFFVLSETLYPGETFGYVNISKITSVGTGAYTVTLTKKIQGASTPEIEQNVKNWFQSPEGKAQQARLAGSVRTPHGSNISLRKAKRECPKAPNEPGCHTNASLQFRVCAWTPGHHRD